MEWFFNLLIFLSFGYSSSESEDERDSDLDNQSDSDLDDDIVFRQRVEGWRRTRVFGDSDDESEGEERGEQNASNSENVEDLVELMAEHRAQEDYGLDPNVVAVSTRI